MAAQADGRIVRPRPEPDGELTPVVTFLDQLLASDTAEEPPMRDATGNLVEVRVLEPWNMHLLTADGTNGEAPEAEAMTAPPEPVLVKLSPTCVGLLVERKVRWLVETPKKSYFGALPRPYVDALMQSSPSSIPVVRAINTAPLVATSGRVIDGAGLDRNTGLLHRIDPLLRACVPADPPTEEEVRDALRFLMEEWLIDVALDPVGKAVAIMLAMTLIERPLLPERPAFFVTAGQRGGGKTTLINMIIAAVLGRRAAAAGWSWSEEERRKALFAYLRQGVACLVWDNISRGSTISCPHIEAALTAAEISDRVLGVSSTETVPSTTLQIFTGNAITPSGRHGEPVADDGARRRPSGSREPKLRARRPAGLDASQSFQDRPRPLYASEGGSPVPPPAAGGQDPLQDLVAARRVASGVRCGAARHRRGLHRVDAPG